MARKGIASIGVEIGAREIRAVEVTPDGRSIRRFATVLLPSTRLDLGVPSDANALADLLKGLSRDLSASPGPAVFGLPAQAVTSRVLDVPSVPDSELKSILEGEVQHFGVVRGFGGMFDYVRINKLGDDNGTEPQALVMACEALQLTSVRDGAERARMDKAAIEPAMLGLLRVAALHHSTSAPCLLVAVSGEIAEIALCVAQKIRLFRRLELAEDSAEDAFLKGMAPPSEDAVPAFLRSTASAGVTNQLVIELKRTLEYAKRELSSDESVKHIVLAISNPKEAPLAQILSEALETEVDLAKAPLPGDDGIRFAAAYGLSAGSFFSDIGIPIFDLSPYDPVAEQNEKQRRILASSMVASIVVILASVAGGLYYGKQANEVQHHMDDDKLALANLQKVALPEAMARQTKLEAYRSLSTFGVPVPQIVDSLTSVLDPKTGLTSIDIAGNQIKMEGESADEASMIQTLEKLRDQKGFHSAFIESFDQSPTDKQKIVRFRLTSSLGTSGGAKP